MKDMTSSFGYSSLLLVMEGKDNNYYKPRQHVEMWRSTPHTMTNGNNNFYRSEVQTLYDIENNKCLGMMEEQRQLYANTEP